MKCTRVEKFLPLYVAGDLTGRRRQRAVEQHLTACEVCRRAADGYRASRELLRAEAAAPDFDDAFYEEIRNSVLARIRSDRNIASPRRLSALFGARLVYAASLALLLVFAALSLRSYTRSTSVEDARHKLTADANHQRPATPLAISTPREAAITAPPEAATNAPRAVVPESNERPKRRVVEEPARVTSGEKRRALKSLPLKPGANIESARNETQPGSPSTRRAPSHAKRNPHAPQVAARAVRASAGELAATGGRGGATAAQPDISSIEIQTSDPNIRIIWLSPATQDAARPSK